MNFVSTERSVAVRWALGGRDGPDDTQAGVGLVVWIRRWRAVRRTRKRLSELDDRMLADLGFYRDQIGLVARRGCLPEWDEM
ncbi:MAG TPA: DUF1127 domain-containing protein [Mesorhizobium sp.]|uniref:DUF1127 domain-containing protein n=1 Tax=Mesorhizobium sp. TaxID=1871066 RepID=UPI002DDCA8C2|nr:DUF1127 domain-containing protein [Mesorhizobium sp.]HEV2507476.1 DUF1127 domain-containing protein [Mesorhizobium sp.]